MSSCVAAAKSDNPAHIQQDQSPAADKVTHSPMFNKETNRYSLATKEFRELEGANKNVLYKQSYSGSCRQAARDLKIPESTLRGQCKAAAKGRKPGQNGRPPILQEEEEKDLIDLIQSKLDKQETVSYEMAIAMARQMIFDHRGNNLPVPFPSISRYTISRLLKKHNLTMTSNLGKRGHNMTASDIIMSDNKLVGDGHENDESPSNKENPPLKRKNKEVNDSV